jgi:hypothetical protein
MRATAQTISSKGRPVKVDGGREVIINPERPAFDVFTLGGFESELKKDRKALKIMTDDRTTRAGDSRGGFDLESVNQLREEIERKESALQTRKTNLGFVVFRSSGKIVERRPDGKVFEDIPEDIYQAPAVELPKATSLPTGAARPAAKNHAHELLLEYEALRDGPGVAWAAFYEANADKLLVAAEQIKTVTFSDAEIDRARAEHLRKAKALLESAKTTTVDESELFAAAAIVSAWEEREAAKSIAPVTLDNSGRSLLLQYQALEKVPVAHGIFFDEHEKELFKAASQQPSITFSDAEIAGARKSLLKDAKALVAQSQARGGPDIEFLDAHRSRLTAALAIIKQFEP